MNKFFTTVFCASLLSTQSWAQVFLGPAPYRVMPEQLTGTAALPSANLRISNGACNRSAIIADYTNNYVAAAVTNAELAWTGSTATCTAGTTSVVSKDRTLQRINYFRRLVGLPDNMTLNQAAYETNCQAASLIMDAQNALDHYPPNTWACYTAEGYAGASTSNLALGVHSASAVKGYIDDPGASNTPVGHRRWVLYSRQTVFGTGSTSDGGANALYVFGPTATPASLPAYIAYPSEGYFPRTLMMSRWSFGIPGANFSAATVSVTDEAGTPIAITQHPYATGYGDNTITWEMPAATVTYTGDADVVYNVTVSGITGAAQSSYTYKVVAVKEIEPILSINNIIHPTCGNNGTATASFSAGAKSYLWSTGETSATLNNVGIGTYTVTVTDKYDCTTSTTVVMNDNSAAAIEPGDATPPSSYAYDCATQALTLNLSTTGTANFTSDHVVGWWITADNPITAAITNQATLNTAIAAALVDPSSIAPTDASMIYKATTGSTLTKTFTCGTNLDPNKTYYATPVAAKYRASVAATTCTATSGAVGNITFNSNPGKFTSIAPTSICVPPTLFGPPTYTLNVTVSGYTGAANQLGLIIKNNNFNGTTLYSNFTLSGNGTYTFTQANFPGYDPGNPGGSVGMTAVAWQQSGTGMSTGAVSMSLNITYPGDAGIPFATFDNYSSCLFGTPFSFNCAAANGTAALTTSSSVLVEGCTESGWTYYTTAADPEQILFGVNWDETTCPANSAARAAATVSVGALSSYKDAGGSGTDNLYALRHYWNISGTQPDCPVSVRFFYDPAEATTIGNLATTWQTNQGAPNLYPLFWFKTDGVQYDPNTHITPSLITGGAYRLTNAAIGTMDGQTYVELGDIASFSGGSGAAGAGGASQPLPITLTSFVGKTEAEHNLLSWTTASEQNVRNFIIERSLDATTFVEIGRVQAVGNSVTAQSYEFKDTKPMNKAYYRLVNLDNDGTTGYSNTILLERKKKSFYLANIYPVPVNDELTVAVYSDDAASLELKLTNIMGQLIDVQKVNAPQGGHTFRVKADHLDAGVYFISITKNNITQITEKFIKK